MGVMKVVFEILVVANDMISKPLLPEFHGLGCVKPNDLFILPGEIRFQGTHDVAKVTLPCRLNEHMEMVVQKDISQHDKGMKSFDITQYFTQQVHIRRIMKGGLPILNDLCNKNCRT